MNSPAPPSRQRRPPTLAAVVKREANLARVDAIPGSFKRPEGPNHATNGPWADSGLRWRRASELVTSDGLAACLLSLACGSNAPPPAVPSPSAGRTQTTAAIAGDGGEIFAFPEATASPRNVAHVSEWSCPVLRPMPTRRRRALACGRALRSPPKRRRRRPLDVSENQLRLRAEGSPLRVAARLTLEGGDLASLAAVERMRAWLDSWGDGGERRWRPGAQTGGPAQRAGSSRGRRARGSRADSGALRARQWWTGTPRCSYPPATRR